MMKIVYSSIDEFKESIKELISTLNLDEYQELIYLFEKEVKRKKQKEDYLANFYRLLLDNTSLVNNAKYGLDVLKSICNNVEKIKINSLFEYKVIIDAYVLTGIMTFQLKRLDESKIYFYKAINFGEQYRNYSKENYYDALNCAYTWYAYFFMMMKKYDGAEKIYNRVLTNYNEVKDDPNYFVTEKESVETSKKNLIKLRSINNGGNNMEEVLKLLKQARIYYLATIDKDEPKVRPFGTAEIFEGHLYIQTGKKKEVFKQIKKNNKVEICATLSDSKWIRISGTLVLDDRVEAKKYLLDKNPHLRGMYDENDDNTAVLYFDKATATISSFTEAPRVIKF